MADCTPLAHPRALSPVRSSRAPHQKNGRVHLDGPALSHRVDSLVRLALDVDEGGLAAQLPAFAFLVTSAAKRPFAVLRVRVSAW